MMAQATHRKFRSVATHVWIFAAVFVGSQVQAQVFEGHFVEPIYSPHPIETSAPTEIVHTPILIEPLPAPVAVVNFQPEVSKQRSIQNSANLDRNSIQGYWLNQFMRSAKLTYPTLHLNGDTDVGDVGIGNSEQFFVIVRSLSKDEYLMRPWETSSPNREGLLFVFRHFDFSSVPLGTKLPGPHLAEVVDSKNITDERGVSQRALIVQPMMQDELPLPSRDRLKSFSEHLKQPGQRFADEASAKRMSNSDVTKARKPKSPRKVVQASHSKVESVLGDQPRFVERRWRTWNGQHSAIGKLVGVGSDAVWIKIRGSKVVRMELHELHPDDRDHALAKKQAILDYRQRKAQLAQPPSDRD